MVVVFYLAIGSILPRGFEVSPKENFRHEFLTSVDDVQGLKGGGSTWMDHHDTYFRFEAAQSVRLRSVATYRQVSMEQCPVAFFRERFPRDADSLDDPSNLIAYVQVAPSGNLRKCLLRNRRTNVYFFRAWKH